MSGFSNLVGLLPKSCAGREIRRSGPRVEGESVRFPDVEIVSFCLLAVVTTTGFAMYRKNLEYKFAASTFHQQCQLAFWGLLSKGERFGVTTIY